MTPVDGIFRQFARLGLAARIEGETLLLSGNTAAIGPRLKQAITDNKPALVAYLKKAGSIRDRVAADIDTALTWQELEAAMAVAVDAFHAETLTRQQTEALARHAAEKAKSIPPSFAEWKLDRFAKSALWFCMDSKVLEERVIIAADNAPDFVHDYGMPVYRCAELWEILDVDPSLVRATHAAKKAIDGVIETTERGILHAAAVAG